MNRITRMFALVAAMLCLGTTQLFAQPANDNLCNAQLLTLGAGCSGTPNGNNTAATVQANEPIPGCFAGNVESVWFKFVGPASGLVKITTDFAIGTNDDTQIAVYALPGGNCATLTNLQEIACDQDGGTAVIYNSIITVAPATTGETFYIQVSGWNGTDGSFCIVASEVPTPTPAPAANDIICNAVGLTVGASCTGTPNGNNTNALYQVGESAAACASAFNSVWYTFVAPATGFITATTNVNVSGTNTSTDLVLYALLPGGSCSNPSSLFEVTCANDFSGFGSTLDTTLVAPGATYYLKVVGGTGGSFCIEVDAVTGFVLPANDSICDAIPLTVGGAPVTGNNTNATTEIGEPFPACFFQTNQSVWFSFVAPSSGLVTITTDIDSSFVTNDDTQIALYSLTGSCSNPAGLTEIACDQDGGSLIVFNSIITAQAVTPGQTYYIQVSGYGGTEGAFAIKVTQLFIPPSDAACNAITLPVDGSIGNYYNTGATLQPGENGTINPPIGDGSGNFAWNQETAAATQGLLSNTVWFKFVAPPSGSVFIDLCNGGTNTFFDTQVAVYEVGSCTNFTTYDLVGASDDMAGGCPSPANQYASQLTVNCITPGQTYYVMVDGWGGETGNFGISVTEVVKPALDVDFSATNPDCPGANNGSIDLAVTGGGGLYTFLWSNGATTEDLTGVAAGNYTVAVSDQCDSTITLLIKLEEAAELNAFAGADTAYCLGGSAVLGADILAEGGLPFSTKRAFGVDLGGQGAFFKIRLNEPALQTNLTTNNESYFADDDAFGVIFALDATNSQLVAIDTATGATTIIGATISQPNHTWTGLGFDPVSASMYGVSTSGTVATLYTIDLGTGAATVVAPISGSNIPIWLAIDTAGLAYVMDIGTDALYSLSLNTGAATLIGSVGFNASFAQDADFDPETNTLYLAAFNAGNGNAELRKGNVTTGSTSLIGEFTGLDEVGAFSIFAETGQKYQYSWTPFLGLSNPFAPNPVTTTPVTTSYVLTVIDDCGTTTTDTVVVSVGVPPVVTTNVSPAFASLNNGAVGLNISGGTAPFTYLWSNGATTDSVSGLAPGSYSVTVSDARGCSVVVTARVDDKTGIEDLGISNLLIYPNPSSGIVNIEMKLNSADKVSLGVYDMNGRQLFEASSEVTASWNRSIDLSRLAAGVYMLKVTTSRGSSYQRITLE